MTATESPTTTFIKPRRSKTSVKRGDYVIVRTGMMERCHKAGAGMAIPAATPGLCFRDAE